MDPQHPVPLWLWRFATWGFGVAVVGVIGLAWGLSRGWADPPRAGPLLWYENFQGDLTRWEFIASNGAALGPGEGALRARLTAPEQLAVGLTSGPAGDFTLEIAGTQTAGDIGAAYGLIFAWQDEAHYSAVLINGNGYAEAYRQAGAERTSWFAWQQWPNILLGTGSNRVRVDVGGGQMIARVNDEVLVEAETDAGGRVGVLARSPSASLRAGSGPSRVVFSWVQMWAPSP
jgi:hypothetical protein